MLKKQLQATSFQLQANNANSLRLSSGDLAQKNKVDKF